MKSPGQCYRVGALLAVLLAMLTACAPVPIRPGTRLWRPSANFDERRPNYVILHQTSNDNIDQALATLTNPQRKVSAHYLIGRDGTIMQLVDEMARAWHAGESYWGGMTDLNSASIGIELDNNGAEEFAEPQIVALLGLLDELRERYRLPAANFIGHGDVAPTRKVDPSHLFPWARLAQRGFGLWCEQPASPAPTAFDALLGLQALGYDIANQMAARAAFRRHFLGVDGNDELGPGERDLLSCLVRSKAAPNATMTKTFPGSSLPPSCHTDQVPVAGCARSD